MTIPNLSAAAIVDKVGNPTRAFLGLINRLIDAHNIASGLAAGAVPNTRQVIAAGGLQAPAPSLSADVGIVFYKAMTDVADLPTAGNAIGDWAFAFNGRKPGEAAGSGTGVPCFWSNNVWIAATSGAAVAA